MRMYRGKRIEGKGWVYGGYSEQRICKPDGMLYLIHATDKTYEVIPESVGQSTGLYDTHGTEVFKGDIIELSCGCCRYVIVWNIAGFIPKSDGQSQEHGTDINVWDVEFEVIGNNIDGVKDDS